MSELLQSGLHPDAEALNAFAEGALPAHERTHTLAHLADCAHCREIVFLAQQADPVAAPSPVPAWRRWLNSAPLFGVGIGVAALAGLALLFITLRPHPNSAPSVATRSPEPQLPLSPAPLQTAPTKPPPRTAQPPAPRPLPKLVPPREPALIAGGPPRPMVAPRGFLGMGMAAGVGRAPTVGAAAPVRSMAMSSVHGDAASQVAAPATPPVVAVNLGNGLRAPTPAAAPTPVASTGATATTIDGLGAPPTSVSETVTVQNAEALSMDSATLASTLSGEARAKQRSLAPTSPAALPSNLPTTYLVSSGPRTLAADTAGALFLSLDAGRHWQPVTAAWPGKVAQLKLAPAPSVFQLITSTGAIWLSTDGLHWQLQ